MSALDLTASLPPWSRPLVPGLGAFLLTVTLTPLVIRLARRMGWVAEPREDRWHERPTALMGGIAIFAGTVSGWALSAGSQWPWALFLGGTLLFLSGLSDDLDGLSPVAKVVAQVAAATVLLLAGWEVAPGWAAWLSVPLTYLWVIGITNAVNLLDNMDGLAAGIAGIATATVAVLAAVAGAWGSAGPALSVVGAAGGFLLYNFHPARVFMGDSGALFLGFSVSALALLQPEAGASGTAAVIAVPAAVMAVPILDTTLVTVRRIVSGRPVTQGGKDHSSHRLVFLGLSERRAVLTLYAVGAGFSVLAVTFLLLNTYLTLAVAGLAAVALAVFGAFLAQVRVTEADRPTRPAMGEASELVALEAVMRNKREIGALLADLMIVVACFVVAHYLRFESGMSPAHVSRMMTLLPAVVLVKTGSLYAFGVYRGLFRYAGSNELIRIAKASTISSGILVVGLVLAFRFEGFSRSVFIIDWILATIALGGLRGAFRGLQAYFSSRRENAGRRVLLYGAGDGGFLAVREIRQNPRYGYEPVGFVDDDPQKVGTRLQGLPVLCRGEDLAETIRVHGVTDVLITTSRMSVYRLHRVAATCETVGARCLRMNLHFGEVEPHREGGAAS